MPATKDGGLKVTSRGFGLWKDKEKREGRRITIDAVADETGLAKMTVRRYVNDGDVTGSPVVAAAVMADYFGVSLSDLLAVSHDEAAPVGVEVQGREPVTA